MRLSGMSLRQALYSQVSQICLYHQAKNSDLDEPLDGIDMAVACGTFVLVVYRTDKYVSWPKSKASQGVVE